MPKKLNLIGERFGKLIVLKESATKQNNKVTWECQCDCGNLTLATTKNLRNGIKQSCGCLKKKNLIGQKFGKLTVIEYTNETRHGRAVWKCQCECGGFCYATTEGLRVGDNTTCGCSNKARENFANAVKVDYTNKRFNKLLVLGPTDMRTASGNQIWKCQCDCGNICYISTNHLQTNNTRSCGCLQNTSIGELKIKEILLKNNIKFKAEYIFPDLPNRRYDFALFNDNNEVIQLIEFDGEQHYFEAPFFNKTLQEQKEIDEEKNQFANSKNIKLTRIPYWKRDTLTLEDLEVN